MLYIIKYFQHLASTYPSHFSKANDVAIVSFGTLKEFVELVMIQSLTSYDINSLDDDLHDVIHF